MYYLEFTNRAEKDLRNIRKYIAKDNPEAGRSFIYDLVETMEKNLSVFPKGYSQYKGTYRMPYKHYVVYYDIDNKKLVVNVLFIVSSYQFRRYRKYGYVAEL